MKKYDIIWDFDGTLLPSEPYDSEQTLLLDTLSNRSPKISSFFKLLIAKVVIFGDKKEWLRKVFKRSYVYLLKGTNIDVLDPVASSLAAKIPKKDRQILWQLKEQGHRMVILSCGTWDLSKRILEMAGLSHCFLRIEANRFQIKKDKICGMDLRIPNPEDKLKWIRTHGFGARKSIVVGDGYTDLPLKKWADIPILIDRTGKKKIRYEMKDFHLISSIPEVVELIAKFS